GKVNTDEEVQHASQMGIRSIPTLVIFKGGQEVERVTGALPESHLRAMFDRILA
ncbi:MAG: thiol reductase thioredoxin, partial [Candidatus Viridilinea halotolerans]